MENNVLYLKISLDFIKPEIYRRIMFPARMSLLDLHHIIQYCFGWEDRHLFIFTVKDMAFVNSSDWEEDAYRYQDAGAAVLADLIPNHVGAGDKFSYEYDLGDGWRHTILVEKLATDEEDLLMPVCVDGKRAGPLEDFGGPFMYQMYLESRQNPQNPDFNNDMIWIPEDFDPEKIDIGKINKKILRDYPIHTLEHESSWITEVSYFSLFDEFSSDWTVNATFDEKKYAEELPFRRDLVTMLNYLKNHRVKGTKATGNFPLKHIRALTAQFVNPPVLDEDIGGRIYKLRTEDDVPDLVFIHTFANVAELILGGEDLEWHLSFLGEDFLNQTPHEQAWHMVKSWFERLNWFFWYPWMDYEDLIEHSEFVGLIIDILLSYPTQEKINIKQLIKDLDKRSPNWICFPRRENPSVLKKYFLINVVLDPMNKLGIIQMESEDVYISLKNFVFDFQVTDFGQSIIQNFMRDHR